MKLHYIKYQIIFLFTIIIILSANCSKQKQIEKRKKIINNFNHRSFNVKQEKNNVIIGIKKLKKTEFYYTFPSKLHRKKRLWNQHNILKIEIENQDQNTYIINQKSIEIPTKNVKVNKQLKKNLMVNEKTPWILSVLGSIIAFPFYYLSIHLLPDTLGISNNDKCGVGQAIGSVAILTSILFATPILIKSIFLSKKLCEKNKNINTKIIDFLNKEVLDISEKNEIDPNTTLKKYILIKKQKTKQNFFLKLFKSTNQNEYIEFSLPIF